MCREHASEPCEGGFVSNDDLRYLTDRIAELEAERDTAFNKGMERAADMLDLNYPLCAKWIRKEIDK